MTTLEGELTLTVRRADGSTAEGRLRALGRKVVLDLPEPVVRRPRRGFGAGLGPGFAGVDPEGLRHLAATLERRGLSLEVRLGGRVLAVLGAVEAPGWQVAVTGSRSVRLGPAGDLFGAGAERVLGRVIRPPRREPARPGRLRLVEQAVAADDVSAEGDEVVVPLDTGTLVLGSHPSCDVVMRGLRPRHAVLGRDADGALVLRAISGTTYVDGSPVLAQRVDAGSEIRLAGRRLRLQVREPALV